MAAVPAWTVAVPAGMAAVPAQRAGEPRRFEIPGRAGGDSMNSSQSFAKFHEKIAPVEERVTKSILNFIRLGFVVIVMNSDEIVWDIEPTSIIQ